MSMVSHASERYLPRRDPVRRYVFALVLLFVVTTLLLSFTEWTLRINTRQMEQVLKKQQARRQLGQIILRELFKLEVILFQLPVLRDDLDLGVKRRHFDMALTKVKTVLGVLQKGGRFVDLRPTNFDNTNQISEVIEYAGPDGGYVIAAIEITPKLIEIEQEGERIFALVESKIDKGRDLNTAMAPGKVLTLLKHVQPTLLRSRESANKIYHESVAAISAQKAAKRTAARWYAGIRVFVIGGIGVMGIVLCARTLRRIGDLLEQRRQAELAMREAHGNLELILSTLPVGVTLIDSGQRVRSINPAGLKLLGYAKAEAVIGRPCSEIFSHENNRPCIKDDARRNGLQLETRLRCQGGEEVAVIKKAIALKIQSEIVYLEAFVDISALKAAQEALLQESSKLSAVIEGMGEGVALTDDQGRLTEVNPCFSTMAGLSREACLGRPLVSFYPERLKNTLEAAAGRFQQGDNNKAFVKENVRIFDLDAIVRLQPIHTASGYAGMVFNVVDVSPLVEERRRAEAASQAKSDFMANMSHELRTPLNHIIGFTELVVDEHIGALNEMQSEYLSDVLASGRHLLSLINDILDLSKVEAGKLDLQPNIFDLTELLTNSLVLVKEKALKHGIKITFEGPPFAIDMVADERKIKQIVYNLLANAVKFTPDGGAVDMIVSLAETRPGPDPAVDTDSQGGEGGWVLLCVRDTGIGLGGADLERIFKPFEQVDQSTERRYGGTGLGLSLTQRMVALHGGCIWAESDGAHQGSRFYVSLPRQVNADKELHPDGI
jgi:PAS domain S-box-containing protein